jgi:hypothetical protein
VEVEAKEAVETFGSSRTRSVHESDLMGAPFRGQATLGHDPEKREYVPSWTDTMSPTSFRFRGNLESGTRATKGRAFDSVSRTEADYRTTELHEIPEERVLEMLMKLPDGNELELLTHVYTRSWRAVVRRRAVGDPPLASPAERRPPATRLPRARGPVPPGTFPGELLDIQI